MGNVKLRYYSVVNGNGFWKPGKHARNAGFRNVPCGPDGPGAWGLASQWNEKWDRARKGFPVSGGHTGEEGAIYPPGSFGDAFRRYRRTDAWQSKKKPATRDEWFVAWRHIKPIFGDVDPNTVDFEDFDAFRKAVEERNSPHTAWRVTKIWRALWKVMIAMKLCGEDPSKGMANTAPRGRSQTWTDGEAARMVKWAIRNGYTGAAALMAVAWDSGLQPGDARALTPGQAFEDAQGLFFDLSRGKTGKAVLATLSRRSVALLDAYILSLPFELLDDAAIFRNRSGRPYTKDKLASDFRTIRKAVFGEGEERKLMDFRRSSAVEAQAGNAAPDGVGKKLGNSIAHSKRLQETYLPAQSATIRLVDGARLAGRGVLRGNTQAQKVATRWLKSRNGLP